MPSLRQGKQLAEGQKGVDVKHLSLVSPPSASQLELAEWGLFPEENANFWHFRCHLAEGVPTRAVVFPLVSLHQRTHIFRFVIFWKSRVT